uniref:NADH dehydrogenase subunit 4 n=1 Tax=Parasacculina shiinoi TaxID=2836419 RepID=UPI002551D9ED|nr:NADH dehydrogenase subunit 4 [Parasacculina shiinoi]WGU20869.1 NADH dehydrogenase subunit 4 [Parasacculina shiinoi]
MLDVLYIFFFVIGDMFLFKIFIFFCIFWSLFLELDYVDFFFFLSDSFLFWILISMILLYSVFCIIDLNLGVVLLFSILLIYFFFMVDVILYFFLLFEFLLIPIFLYVTGWGYQVERLQASIYLMVYSLVSSIPFLFFCLYTVNCGLVNFIFLYYMDMKSVWIVFLLLVFLVKFPIYFGHLWLPKAHVESPTGSSIILAGIMLKMGYYGISHFFCLVNYMNFFFLNLVFVVGLVGIFFSSIICFMSLDMKTLVAYSSVSHMCFSLVSLMTATSIGYGYSLLASLCHSFCSGGLFFLCGILYYSLKTRNILSITGMYMNSSLLCSWIYVFGFLNMSFPISMMIMSEFMMMSSVVVYSFFVFFVCFFCFIMISNYNLFFTISVTLMEMMDFKLVYFDLKSNYVMFFFFFFLSLVYFVVNFNGF